MAEQEAPARGAARRARTDAALTSTVLAQLGETGYAGLTIEGVAAASGIAKTTIYRRWASKAEMVFALAIHTGEQRPEIDTGSLAGDVRELAVRAVALISHEPGRSVLPGLLADMVGNPALNARLRELFVAAARADVVAIVERARSRGELESGESNRVAEFHAALLGIPYAHVHLLAEAEPEQLLASLTRQLLVLLRA